MSNLHRSSVTTCTNPTIGACCYVHGCYLQDSKHSEALDHGGHQAYLPFEPGLYLADVTAFFRMLGCAQSVSSEET